jgi:hypothetical protein
MAVPQGGHDKWFNLTGTCKSLQQATRFFPEQRTFFAAEVFPQIVDKRAFPGKGFM